MVTAGRSGPPDGRRRITGHHDARGFTYVWILFAIALLGVGLVAVSEVWEATARRQKAEQLAWVGAQYVQAIGSYYQATPGAVKVYPARLEDLIQDGRFLTIRRHLRELYPNPLTGRQDWELKPGPGGTVMGVRVKRDPAEGPAPQALEFIYTPAVP